jgi:hypothetical protein
MMYKITKILNLNTKRLLSVDGEKIYLLINADEDDIKLNAEAQEHNLQLAIGLSDLQSLEPVDEKFRPFRQIENNDDEIESLENDLLEFFAIFLNAE